MSEKAEVRRCLVRAAQSFRLGQEGAGHDALAQLLGLLQRQLASGSAHVDLLSLQTVLQELLAAQERGDLLWVADLLEHELDSLLQR